VLVLLLSHYEKKKQIHDKLKKAAFFCMLFHITQQKSFFQHFLENFFLTKNLRFLIPPPNTHYENLMFAHKSRIYFLRFTKKRKRSRGVDFESQSVPQGLREEYAKILGRKTFPRKKSETRSVEERKLWETKRLTRKLSIKTFCAIIFCRMEFEHVRAQT